MMKLKEEEERRVQEEQAAAREAAAREAAAREAAARETAINQAGPQTVDTPSKLSGKSSQSQLAQMLNRFAKKSGAGATESGDAPAYAAAASAASIAAHEVGAAPELSTSQAPIDDQQAKSQKKFAELAQRLKSNAAKSSEAPAVIPPEIHPAPGSVAINQQQPFSKQADVAGSSYGSNMRGAGSPAAFNNADFQPSSLPDFELPGSSAGFPDARSGEQGKEPVQSEAFNKKIEAVKKKIEALKANVPGNAPAGGATTGSTAAKQDFDAPKVFESAPRPSMSSSSANLGGPPVNRLLEAAQRAVETGSVSRLPAQKTEEPGRFEPPLPASAPAPASAPSSRREEGLNTDSAVRAAEISRTEAPRSAPEAYSSFRDIEASIKNERTKSRDVPDRSRVRQSFNKQRPPAMLIGGAILAVVAVVLVFSPLNKMIPGAITSVQNMFHPTAPKVETTESTDIDELIQTGKLDRARALEDKQTKANKWTAKDSERHIKMAEKYAESDPPEYDLAIEVLNKIPKKAQSYRKAKSMIRSYQNLKRKASH
jgi:hypothetical protein